ncbi:MAG: Ryanodine receptor Ryr [Clostridia bacterium]|nr:Ryanodine receptor Ryr [Clostridia bacterium]
MRCLRHTLGAIVQKTGVRQVKKYVPKPLDTADIQLSGELCALAEALAKNTHEVWSAGKIADGWIYGEEIDADKKTHPSLVEYEQLSEAQKDYDRRTSAETLKFVVANGFKISKN